MKKILYIILLILVSGCNGELMEGVGGDSETSDDTSFSLTQKMRGIWIVGGTATVAGSTMISQLDLYDPVTHTWYSDVAADASGSYTPTSFGMAASVSGKLYVIGGAITNASVTSTVFEYTISTNTWRTMTSMPVNLMSSVVYVQNNMIYVLGGTNSITAAGVNVAYHYKFDPSGGGGLGSWTLLTPTNLPEAKSAMAGHNFNGIVSYAGGRINTGASRTTNDLYVVNTNNFTAGTETAIPAARGGMAHAGYSDETGSYLFLVGGASAVVPATSFFSLTSITFVPQASSFYAYTPPATTNGWFTGTYHPAFTGGTTTGILFGSAVVSPYNGSTSKIPTLYVFGGLKDSPPVTVTDTVYSTTATGTTSGTNYVDGGWTTRTVMPRARYGHSAVIINE